MKNQSENKVYTLAEVLGKHTIAELKQMTQVLEGKKYYPRRRSRKLSMLCLQSC